MASFAVSGSDELFSMSNVTLASWRMTFVMKDNFRSHFFCCDATTKHMFLAQISILSHEMEQSKMEI
jgi:hypothetical protein